MTDTCNDLNYSIPDSSRGAEKPENAVNDPNVASVNAGPSYVLPETLLSDDLSLLDAAQALAAAGLRVVPLTSQPTKAKPGENASKNPGGLLGRGWQNKSSSDPDTLANWFTEPDTTTLEDVVTHAEMYRSVPFDTIGIGVHAGPDILIVDVDNAQYIPDRFWDELEEAPFQSSSAIDGRRGHYYFRPRAGFHFGHTSAIPGVDGMDSPGEIRHGNAIAVSAPSQHRWASLGREYKWKRVGAIPEMSEELAVWLESRKEHTVWNGVDIEVGEATLDSINSFRETCINVVAENILPDHVAFMTQQAEMIGLHNAWLPSLIDLMQMALCGFVNAAEAIDAAGDAFIALRSDDTRGGNWKNEDEAQREYVDLLKWALGKVQAKYALSPDSVKYETYLQVTTYYGVSLLAPMEKPEDYVELPPMGHRAGPVASAKADEWAALDSFNAPPPPLTLTGLPDVLRQFVIEASEALQVPTDLVLNHALGALSSAPYGTVNCEIRPGWVVSLNLAVMTLARSGELKSPLNALVMKPFDQIEADRRDLDRDATSTRAGRIAALTTRLDAVKRSLTSSKTTATTAVAPAASVPSGSGFLSSVLAIGSPYAEVEKLEVEILRLKGKFLCWASVIDDATPEVVGVRLGGTYTGAVLMRSDETNIFSHIAGQGRNTSGTEKAKVYLHGVSGDKIQTDRLGRDEVYVERPSLSLALMMQPEVFDKTIRNSPSLVDIGIVPRLLIVRPSSTVGARKADPKPMAPATESAWASTVKAIATTAEAHVTRVLVAREADAAASGKSVSIRQVDPRTMSVTAAGWDLLRAYKARIEPELGKGGRLELIGSWGSKSTTYMAQIAALFTLMDNPSATEVDSKYLVVAEKLLDGYAYHHLALADVPTDAAAEAIWSRLADVDESKFDAAGFLKLREVRRLIQNQAWFKNSDMRDRDQLLRDALSTLEVRGYVKIEQSIRRDSLKIKRRPDLE